MDALKLLSRSTGLKSKISKPLPQTLPSASGHSATQDGQSAIPSKKRKRDAEPEEGDVTSKTLSQELSEGDVRQIQKKHKIKIVDLNRFRASSESSESRKTQKEVSRIFPQPLTTFDQLQSQHRLNPALVRNVSSQGYFEPTEVQIATLPLLLKGTSEVKDEPDLLTIAPTGSGKTLAFLIPLIEKISKSHREGSGEPGRHASAIILAPTKELVAQIVNEGRKLCAGTGVRISSMRKGMRLFTGHDAANDEESQDDEEANEDSGDETSNQTATVVKSDILVSTPLSLVHVLCPSEDGDQPTSAHPLPNIQSLIFDEGDVLLDPLFRSQTLAVWSACTAPSLRVSLWSATIGSNVEELVVQAIGERQKRLKMRRSQRPPLLRTIIGLKDTSLPTISHQLIYTATESGKLLGMRQLLHPSRPTPTNRKGKDQQAASPPPPRPPFLVFAQTIARAQSLYTELQYDIPASAGGSARVAVLHSSLPDRTRATVMQNFRQGKIWVLITTDLLSRGVDFRGVNVVVNYDIPTTAAAYVHRAGRTGRAGRQGGVCVSFYTKEDVRYVKGIANVIAASEKAQAQTQTRSDGAAGAAVGGGAGGTHGGIQPWLLHALPSVSKSARKDLKLHGVQSRRAIHADDDEKTKRMKRKARIGTQSGYEKRETNRKRDAVEASVRAKRNPRHDKDKDESEEWNGF